MDASDKPISQAELPKLFEKCQKEVDDSLKKLEQNRTKEQKEQDL